MKTHNLNLKLGKDTSGNYFSYDLSEIHHLLIGGTAGSGKTQFIHNTILQLAQNNNPEEIKFIMFDGNAVDLNIYSKIPHMYVPVINEVIKFRGMLKWLDSEQMRRYDLFKKEVVRTSDEYNEKFGRVILTKIVVIVNELAELAHDYKEIEHILVRIMQFSKNSGINIVFATGSQNGRVIKGLIKANIPSRIAFKTNNATESRLILDQKGAEELNGKGDMLFISPVSIKPIRLQGDYISERELNERISELEKQTPDYNEELLSAIENSGYEFTEGELNKAIKILKEAGKVTTSLLMVGLKISYAKASKILDILDEKGIVSKVDPITKRNIYKKK